MKNLIKITGKLQENLIKVKTDEEIVNLGFNCKKKLCDYKGYETLDERLWVWVKEQSDGIFIAITYDMGNCFCNMAYTDIYIKEVIEEVQDILMINDTCKDYDSVRENLIEIAVKEIEEEYRKNDNSITEILMNVVAKKLSIMDTVNVYVRLVERIDKDMILMDNEGVITPLLEVL